MNKLTFRHELIAEDLVYIENITRSTGFFEGVEGEITCALEDAREVLEKGVEASGAEYVIAEVDGTPRAFLSFGPVPITENTWFMYWLAVHESLRGKGYGRKLMNYTLEYIFQKGARKVFLQTSGRPQYEPTRSFYLGVGFAQEGVLKDYYKEGEDTVYFSMTKDSFNP